MYIEDVPRSPPSPSLASPFTPESIAVSPVVSTVGRRASHGFLFEPGMASSSSVGHHVADHAAATLMAEEDQEDSMAPAATSMAPSSMVAATSMDWEDEEDEVAATPEAASAPGRRIETRRWGERPRKRGKRQQKKQAIARQFGWEGDAWFLLGQTRRKGW